MPKPFERMTISQAIQTVKKEHNLSDYKLAKILKLKNQSMIKRYAEGQVQSMRAKHAYQLYTQYGILVDCFNSVEELEACYEAL